MVPPSFSLSILRGPADLLQTLGASSAGGTGSGVESSRDSEPATTFRLA